MKHEELEKRLKDGKLDRLYLIYGEENFLLENSLKKIKNLFGEKIARNKLYFTRWNKF